MLLEVGVFVEDCSSLLREPGSWPSWVSVVRLWEGRGGGHMHPSIACGFLCSPV